MCNYGILLVHRNNYILAKCIKHAVHQVEQVLLLGGVHTDCKVSTTSQYMDSTTRARTFAFQSTWPTRFGEGKQDAKIICGSSNQLYLICFAASFLKVGSLDLWGLSSFTQLHHKNLHAGTRIEQQHRELITKTLLKTDT